jgi:ribosome-associated protein
VREEERFGIRTPDITLASFLKWTGVTPTGGQAKLLVRRGEVRVNGEVEIRPSRRLLPGDRVEVGGRELVVASP